MSTPTKPTSWRAQRAKIAGLSNRKQIRAEDDEKLIEARRDLRAMRLEEHVLRVLDGAPPLSQEQRDHIADLLRAGGGVCRD